MKAPPILSHRRSGVVQPPLEAFDNSSSCPDSPDGSYTNELTLSGDSHGPVLPGSNNTDLVSGIKQMSLAQNGLPEHHNGINMNGTHNNDEEHGIISDTDLINETSSDASQVNGDSHQQINGDNSQRAKFTRSFSEPSNNNRSQPIQINGTRDNSPINRNEPLQINGIHDDSSLIDRTSSQPFQMNGTQNYDMTTQENTQITANNTRSAFPFSAPAQRKISADTPFVFPEPRHVHFKSTSNEQENTSFSSSSLSSSSSAYSTSPSGPQIRAFRPGYERVWSVLPEGEEDEEINIGEDKAGVGGLPQATTKDEELEKMSRTLGDHSPFVRQHLLHVENRFFEMFGDKDKQIININKFLTGLTATGMRPSDPRLKETRQNLKKLQDSLGASDLQGIEVNYETFMGIISDNLEVLVKAFSSSFIIPDFREFCNHLDEIYNICRSNNSGKVASYIPQLARSKSEHWAMSVCTVDGQRYSLGDVNTPFTLQSCSYATSYAMVLGELGAEEVHSRVAMEPSGRYYNELCLDYNNKPHNPMINAGAIMTAALLRPELSAADRFDFVFNMYKRLAGDEFLGFNNAVFLSEKECADRNFALAYFMRENKCFPEGTRLHETLEFYFQLCSLEITAESGAVMAATLANGGVNPLTGDPVLTGDAVRNTLTLMHSCGMYNYSGQFAFKVGLPSKSGVSGCVLLVVPNTMGICLWSPPLDSNGNSCRAVQFCMELVSKFNFHNFDNLRGHFTTKVDPRTVKAESTAQILFDLLFSAAAGDLSALRRHSLSGTDMQAQDYDGRTALHVATSEGHVEIVEYLLRNCQVYPLPKDRWGRTPFDDANSFSQPRCAALILESCKKRGLELPIGHANSTITTTNRSITPVNCEV